MCPPRGESHSAAKSVTIFSLDLATTNKPSRTLPVNVMDELKGTGVVSGRTSVDECLRPIYFLFECKVVLTRSASTTTSRRCRSFTLCQPQRLTIEQRHLYWRSQWHPTPAEQFSHKR